MFLWMQLKWLGKQHSLYSKSSLLMWYCTITWCNCLLYVHRRATTTPNDKLTGRNLLHILLLVFSSPSSAERVYVDLLQWQLQIKWSHGTKEENTPLSLKIDLPGYWCKGQSDIVNANICAEPCSTKCPNPSYSRLYRHPLRSSHFGRLSWHRCCILKCRTVLAEEMLW